MIQEKATTERVEPKPQENKKTKKRFTQQTLKADDFEKANGVRTLYEMSKKLNLDHGQAKVDQTMRNIVVTLKSWQYRMMPKYSFDYFVQRSQALGSKSQTAVLLLKYLGIHE